METVKNLVSDYERMIREGGESLYNVYKNAKKLSCDFKDLDVPERDAWALVFASTKKKFKAPKEKTEKQIKKEDKQLIEKLKSVKTSPAPNS